MWTARFLPGPNLILVVQAVGQIYLHQELPKGLSWRIPANLEVTPGHWTCFLGFLVSDQLYHGKRTIRVRSYEDNRCFGLVCC